MDEMMDGWTDEGRVGVRKAGREGGREGWMDK